MVRMRLPSAKGSACGTRSLPACDAAEYGSDGHTKSREVPLPQNVSGHDFTRGEHIARMASRFEGDRGVFIHLYAQVGECNSRPQRIAEKGGRIDGERPVRFGRRQTVGAAI